MRKHLTLTFLVIFAALAVALFLMPGGLIQADNHVIEFAENGDGAVATFTAADPEGAMPIVWDIATGDPPGDLTAEDAADSDHFDISEDGVLTFDIGGDADAGDMSVAPDYENPQGGATNTNTYNVVVSAADAATGTPMTGYHKVTVMVTNVDEPGKVTWATAADGSTADNPALMQFQIGALLTASATDGDVSGTDKAVTNAIWRWYRGSTEIDGATGNTYTVAAADVGSRIRVVATYVVSGNVVQEDASLTSDYPVLTTRIGANELEFDPTTVARTVAEGEKGMMVGAPVTVKSGTNHGAVNYALGGADAAKFDIDQRTGQITTAVDLNYEAAAADDANCADRNACVVTVAATDASGDAAGTPANVNIAITNVNENPMFVTDGTGPPEADSPMEIQMVPENAKVLFGATTDGYGTDNATAVDVTYGANDPEGLNVNLTLMGRDGAMFTLSNAGVLSFKEEKDHEMPTDANGDNVYEVTVRASDGTLNEDRMVMVTVTDVDEAPEIIEGGLAIAGSSSENYPEGDMDSVATFTARGPMADMAMWSLEGDDAMHFSVSMARGAMTELMFRSTPDFEMPRGMAMSDTNSNTYMVTLKANDGENMATHDVRVMVADMNEDGTVTFSPMTQPQVGTEITATLEDEDSGVTDETWQWSKSMTMDGPFTAIGEATSASYTPVEADDGYYLKAVVTYTDVHDEQMAEATTAMAVTSNQPPAFGMADTTRDVAENTAAGMNIGDPVAATDPNGDTLTYTLSGTDAASFDIGLNTGQLMTKDALDYETKESYVVTVTATDPDGESATTTVAINVTNQGLDTPYDANDDGVLTLEEVYQAVDDYFDHPDRITLEEVNRIVDMYFDQEV